MEKGATCLEVTIKDNGDLIVKSMRKRLSNFPKEQWVVNHKVKDQVQPTIALTRTQNQRQ